MPLGKKPFALCCGSSAGLCVCVCGNAKYQKMDKCYLAYFKSFLSHSANTTFANRKYQTASFFRLGPILALPAKILGPLADDSPLKEHQPQRSQWEGIPMLGG